MSTRYGLLLMMLLVPACRSSTSGTAPTLDPRVPPVVSSDISPEISAWTISPVSGDHRYTSTTKAILESTGLPTGFRDTVTSTVVFTIGISRNVIPPSYSARIESVSVQGGARTRDTVASPGLLLPFAFTGRLEPGRITLEVPKTRRDVPADCTTEVLAAVPVVQRSLVLVPIQLHKGMMWTDSAVAGVCSGPFQTLLSTIRTYVVRGQILIRGRTALLLEQQSRTTFTGEGTQQQHHVRVRGDGSGKALLTVDAQTGALIEAAADHTTALTVTSSGRNQQFTQVSREQVSRLDT
jgi:hypothetical protein